MASKVLAGFIYRICELYIDDVLIHGPTEAEFLAKGTSFMEEKRLKVSNFPLPQTKKALLQFLELGNYFRDHVPNLTELCKPLRDMCPHSKLEWTPEHIHAFEVCQQAISNCQELYFLDDTSTQIVQIDASDYDNGGYVFMVTNGKVRVIRYFSKALQGAQLNWSDRETECYGIYYGVKQFEDLLD